LPTIQWARPLRTPAGRIARRMPEATMPQPFSPPPSGTLNSLIRQIALGDRAALRLLYDALWEAVGGEIRQLLPDPQAAEGALYATFVEVWWLARFHVADDTDVAAWISVVAAYRALERRSIAEPVADDADSPRVALAGLLGGPLTSGLDGR
jgi:hypothetical protein